MRSRWTGNFAGANVLAIVEMLASAKFLARLLTTSSLDIHQVVVSFSCVSFIDIWRGKKKARVLVFEGSISILFSICEALFQSSSHVLFVCSNQLEQLLWFCTFCWNSWSYFFLLFVLTLMCSCVSCMQFVEILALPTCSVRSIAYSGFGLCTHCDL